MPYVNIRVAGKLGIQQKKNLRGRDRRHFQSCRKA